MFVFLWWTIERRDPRLSVSLRNRFPSMFSHRPHHHLSEDVDYYHCLCLLWLKVLFLSGGQLREGTPVFHFHLEIASLLCLIIAHITF